MKTPINIFVSYSSRDRELRELLVDGLKGHLTHRGDFEYQTWTDTQIDLGANWEDEINQALQQSNVALLLVSANFAASNFINKKELPEFFKKQKEEGALILPVLVRQYEFQYFESLSTLNFFKTYYPEYGFNKPIERNKLLPFDKLAENEQTTDAQLNNYFAKLASYIHTAVTNHFGRTQTGAEQTGAEQTGAVQTEIKIPNGKVSSPDSTIRELIARGKLQEAIKAFLEFTKGKPEHNAVILQSGRLNSILADERKGIIRQEDANRIKNQITFALLEYLDDFEF